MRRLFVFAFHLQAFFSACTPEPCPPGTEFAEERCVAVDAATGDASFDAGTNDDAEAIEDAMVVAVDAAIDERARCERDGTCSRCTTSEDCSDASPLCVANECRPCSEGRCNGSETVREIFARECSQFSSTLPESTFATIRASYCAGAEFTHNNRAVAIREGIDANRLRFNALAFEQCTDAPLRTGHPCVAILGSVTGGGIVMDPMECATGRTKAPTCPGICTELVPEFGDCSRSSDCEAPTSCVRNKCLAGGHIGDPCLFGSCAEGRCNSDDVCAVEYEDGDPCPVPGKFCTDSLLCDPMTSHCRPLHGLGESCDLTRQGFRCAEGYECDRGTCAPARSEGAECDATTSMQCASGTRCVAGHCERVRTRNEACGPAECASGLACVGGRCITLPDVGEACNEIAGCVRGTCIDRVCMSLALGTPCTRSNILDNDALDLCGQDSTCIAVSDAAPVCRPDAEIGDACGPNLAQCASASAHCASGVCVPNCSGD